MRTLQLNTWSLTIVVSRCLFENKNRTLNPAAITLTTPLVNCNISLVNCNSSLLSPSNIMFNRGFATISNTNIKTFVTTANETRPWLHQQNYTLFYLFGALTLLLLGIVAYLVISLNSDVNIVALNNSVNNLQENIRILKAEIIELQNSHANLQELNQELLELNEELRKMVPLCDYCQPGTSKIERVFRSYVNHITVKSFCAGITVSVLVAYKTLLTFFFF